MQTAFSARAMVCFFYLLAQPFSSPRGTPSAIEDGADKDRLPLDPIIDGKRESLG